MKKLIILSIIMLSIQLWTVGQSKKSLSKSEKKAYNWFNKDLKKDKVFGVSTDIVYNELLKGLSSKPVIVAVIDGGVDINHEDLKGLIWVNSKEIPNNGIDDDKNGYIDDYNGWNFIGNAEGKNLVKENLEVTRIYKKYQKEINDEYWIYSDPSPLADMLKAVSEQYTSKYNDAKSDYNAIEKAYFNYIFADSIIGKYLGKPNFTKKDLKKFNPKSEVLIKSKAFLEKMYKYQITKQMITSMFTSTEDKYKYQYNTDFNGRDAIFPNDDLSNNSNRFYGNSDVKGERAGHGTFVAGCIAANRNNNIGSKGIADNVIIMPIRVVPDGDEHDKDVANAIRYAIDNGAQVINMSFGKQFSMYSNLVTEVLEYAREKNVLLIHASGNDGVNNDSIFHYPINIKNNWDTICKNWITVGASSKSKDANLAASFSNYGKKSVDIFAPGVDIYSLEPENKYDVASGTSFACPIVSGVAALLLSYFPDLSAMDVKEILLKSSIKITDQVNEPGKGKKAKNKVNFNELSATGGIVNAYSAVKMAQQWHSAK